MNENVIDIVKLAAEGSFLAFDVEGDGNPSQRPVELSFCEFNSTGFVGEYYFLIDPERSISHFASHKHGLLDDMVRGRETMSDVSHRIRELVRGRFLVGHASINDVHMISTGIPDFLLLPKAVIDTQRIARHISRLQQIPVPEALSTFAATQEVSYGDAPTTLSRSSLHSASTDAWLTGTVFKAVMRLLPDDCKSRLQYHEMLTIRVSDARRRDIEAKIAEQYTETPKP